MTEKSKGEADQEGVRRAVDDLVRRVPQHAIRTLITEIDHKAPGNDSKTRALRGALVQQFNRLRPLKARRLFTGLYEPLLVDDPILYRCRDRIPGLVQRVDVGGLWAALERLAFPKLAMDVQDQLDQRSSNAMIDDVLLSPDALAMRAEMCRQAAQFLEQLPNHRKVADAFLAVANAESLNDAVQRSPHLTDKHPLDLEALAFHAAYLRDCERLLPILEGVVREIGDPIAGGDQKQVSVDSLAAALVGYSRNMRAAFPARGTLDPMAWLPALAVLNVKRRYDVILRYLREYASATSVDNHPLHQAVFAHFAASALTLTDVSRALFDTPELKDGQSLAMPKPVRELLESAIRRLDQTLQLLGAAGLMSHRAIGPRVRPSLAEATAVLTGLVIPVCTRRTLAALKARFLPEPDQDDLAWLLDMIRVWGTTLGRVGYASAEVREMRAHLRDAARDAFVAATKMEPGDDPEARMAHVVRVSQLAAAIGETVSPWISPVSQGLQHMVRHELENPSPPSPEIDFVVDEYMAAVRNELGRSRHWQSADLVRLLKLYEDRRR